MAGREVRQLPDSWRQLTDSASIWAEVVLFSGSGTRVIFLTAFLRQKFTNICLVGRCLLVFTSNVARKLSSFLGTQESYGFCRNLFPAW